MVKKDWTVKQHFVPQTYLENFSPNGYGVYRFDLKKQLPSSKTVPIKSVAYEKNLYESVDVVGNFNMRNYIENHLAQVEGIFSTQSSKLLSRIHHNPFGSFNDFMTEEDVAFWLDYITIQLLRMPISLRAAERAVQKYIDYSISDEDAHTHILSNSFPFFSDCKAEDRTIFNEVLKLLCKMNFYICIDHTCSLWTSDHPVCGSISNFASKGFDLMFFPVSPNVAIILTPVITVAELQKYECHILTEEQVIKINSNLVYQATKSIFSKTAFSFNDIIQIIEIANSEQTKRFHAIAENIK